MKEKIIQMQDNGSTRMKVEKQTQYWFFTVHQETNANQCCVNVARKTNAVVEFVKEVICILLQHRTCMLVLGNALPDRCGLVKRRALTKFCRSGKLEKHSCGKIPSKLQDWKKKVLQPWNKFFHRERESKPFCPVHGENNKQMLIVAAREIKVRYEEKFSDIFMIL